LLIPTWDDKVDAHFDRSKIDRSDAREFLNRLVAFFEENGYGGTLVTPFGDVVVKPRCKRQ
jgi:hypothetical protein